MTWSGEIVVTVDELWLVLGLQIANTCSNIVSSQKDVKLSTLSSLCVENER